SSRSPTCSTRSLRSVHTKRRGRPKLDSKPSKPERGSALTPSSSPDSSPWPGRACSSASARRSRPRLTTSSSEAQPSKTRPRGDAHQHRQSDEDHESHDQEIREAEPRQHPTQIVPDEIRADRSANESGSSAHDHPDQKSLRLARASACEDDSKDGIDRGRERDPDESQRGAAGQPRSSSSASSRATRRTSPASRSSARRGASWTKPSTPRESTVTRSTSRTRWRVSPRYTPILERAHSLP